jgi:hypothetical protein
MLIPRQPKKSIVAPKSFSLPESVLDKSKARFRRLQNSPSAQTLVIADLALRQDLLAKTLSMSVQMDYGVKSWLVQKNYSISKLILF